MSPAATDRPSVNGSPTGLSTTTGPVSPQRDVRYPSDRVRYRLVEQQRRDPSTGVHGLRDEYRAGHVAVRLTSTVAVRLRAPVHRSRPVFPCQATFGGRRDERTERGVHEPGQRGRQRVLRRLRPGAATAHDRLGHAAASSSAVFAPPNAAFRLSAYRISARVGYSTRFSGQSAIGCPEAGVDRQPPVLHRERGQDQFEQAGRLQRLTVHGLRGADRRPSRVRTQRGTQRRRLGRVAGRGTGAVRVDVAQFLGGDPGPVQRGTDGPGQTRAVRRGLHHVVPVARARPTRDAATDPRRPKPNRRRTAPRRPRRRPAAARCGRR